MCRSVENQKLLLIVFNFYIVLFTVLEQTDCAVVTCDSK